MANILSLYEWTTKKYFILKKDLNCTVLLSWSYGKTKAVKLCSPINGKRAFNQTNQARPFLSSRLTFEKGYRRVKRFWTKMCSQTYSKRSVTAFRWINEDRFLGVFNMATSSLKKISLISNPLHYMIVILCKNNNNKFILSVSSSTTICIEPLVLCIK